MSNKYMNKKKPYEEEKISIKKPRNLLNRVDSDGIIK